mmetsp:Transcript_6046/g.16479  ORF Transcript_6046/g.16479 Transcript_6046/m.16479 type:complete len:142 (-) Transcript_6046:272-697(-)
MMMTASPVLWSSSNSNQNKIALSKSDGVLASSSNNNSSGNRLIIMLMLRITLHADHRASLPPSPMMKMTIHTATSDSAATTVLPASTQAPCWCLPVCRHVLPNHRLRAVSASCIASTDLNRKRALSNTAMTNRQHIPMMLS